MSHHRSLKIFSIRLYDSYESFPQLRNDYVIIFTLPNHYVIGENTRMSLKIWNDSAVRRSLLSPLKILIKSTVRGFHRPL